MITFRPAKSCCCCSSLRHGTLVIAWLTVILSGLNFVGVLRELDHLSDVDFAVLDIKPDCDDACLQTAHSSAVGISISSLVMDAVSIGLSVLLIMGVKKDRPRLMTPYIVYMAVWSVLVGLFFIAGVVALSKLPMFAFIFSVIMIFFLLLSLHFLHVVVSYQRQVRQTLGEEPMHLEEEIATPYITKDS